MSQQQHHRIPSSDEYQNNFNISTYTPVAKLELSDQSMVYPGKFKSVL
jgi:hypothetical protein